MPLLVDGVSSSALPLCELSDKEFDLDTSSEDSHGFSGSSGVMSMDSGETTVQGFLERSVL